MISKAELFKPPIMFFGMPMGLLGIALEIRHLEIILGWERLSSLVAMVYAWFILALLVTSALPHLVNSEGRSFYKSQWQGSVTLFDFSILTLTSMMLMLSLNPYRSDHLIWVMIFYLVMAFHTFLNIAYISRWLQDDKFDVTQFRVSVFILLSGNFMVVITGHYFLPESQIEFLWFYFAVSLMFWFVFMFILLYRLMFESRLPENLRPSLFIFLSPPSLGVVAYALLTHMAVPSGLSWAMFYGAMFFLLLWLYSFNHFRKIKPSMVGWAYIFPLASFDMAAQFIYLQTHQPFFFALAVVVMLVNVGIALFLSTQMIKSLFIKIPTH